MMQKRAKAKARTETVPISQVIGASLAALALALVLALSFAGKAHAQINLNIGIDEAKVRADLTRQGFNRIEPTKRSVTFSKYIACKEGTRYKIIAFWHGGYEFDPDGRCPPLVDKKSIRQTMRQRGYERISVEDRAGKYLAIGCLRGIRQRVEFDHSGRIIREKRVGYCERELEPADITAKLEAEGYNRVEFKSRRKPYLLEACRETDRLEMTVDGSGRIGRQRKTGTCRTAINPADLEAVIAEKGFDRITITDDRLPRYKAVGCLKNDRIEVTINRFGEMINQQNIGTCPRPYSAREIQAAMEENGFVNIKVKNNGDGTFSARGCIDGRMREIVLTRYGEMKGSKETGKCVARRISEIRESLENRRFDDLEIYAEGCTRGRRVRITLDEFGNPAGREVVGNCSR